MAYITLDHQIVEQTCPHCHRSFSLCQSSVYDEGKPSAIYLAALHCCQPGALVNLGVSIIKGYNTLEETTAIALKAVPSKTEVQGSIVEPQDSPWETETYLGPIMGKEEARASQIKKPFPSL
jgi:hypothetical protein